MESGLTDYILDSRILSSYFILNHKILTFLKYPQSLFFFNDILIYSKDYEEHIKHLRTVFEILKVRKYFLRKQK